MKRKDIKLLFKSIRNHDNDIAMDLIRNIDGIVHSTAKLPPKKDDGQIPLQVAFKTGNHEIAELLIENGSNVNFIESESVNEWTAPVLHDCIMSAVNSVLFWFNEHQSKSAISLLKKMIELGANPNSRDSFGNSCLDRALLDTRQVVTHPKYIVEMDDQLKSIFTILINAGADATATCETRETAEENAINFGLEKFINPAT